MAPEAIVLSPGPCTPNEAGICLDLIAAAAGRMPILGVCLGHQAIGQAFGGEVVRAPAPMHGKVSADRRMTAPTVRGPAEPVSGHPLSQPDGRSAPPARGAGGHRLDRRTALIMGLRHRTTCRSIGVQFHPESIASEHGHRILGQFPGDRPRRRRRRARRLTAATAVSTNLKPVLARLAAGETLDEAEAEAAFDHHHVRRGDARADRRAADGDAGARRDGAGTDRRGARHARAR